MKLSVFFAPKHTFPILALYFAAQLCYQTCALVQNEGIKRISVELRASSKTLPILPEDTNNVKIRRNLPKNKNPIGVTKNPTSNNSPPVSLPSKIPRLSDLLDEKNLDDFSHVNKASSKARSKASPLRERGKRSQPAEKGAGATEPWRAGFKASIRTQGRIKKAFSSPSRGISRNQKAKNILKTLLSTPPHQCNAANIICALSYSAKVLGTRRTNPDQELRSMLFETVAVLHELVNARLLNSRQLCNACWAIAKHFDRDSELLPPPPEAAALSSELVVGTAETWNMNGSKNKIRNDQNLVDETIDEIAKQLVEILEETHDVDGENCTPPKIGELCMASWAYGKLRPRHTPPGWQVPRQLGKLRDAKRETENLMSTTNIITFERWNTFGQNDQGQEVLSESQKVTDELFDAIGVRLCRNSGYFSLENNLEDESEEKRFKTCLEDCSWSELANLGWSFASHGSSKSAESEMLLLGLAREARYRLKAGGDLNHGVKFRDIAQLLWALGTLQADNFRLANDLVYLVEALSDHLRLDTRGTSFNRGRPLRRWSCADLVQVAMSLAHARIDESNLLRAVYEESNYRLIEGCHIDSDDFGDRRSFRAWEVSVLLWAQARLYLKAPEGQEFEDFTIDATKFFLKGLSNGSSLASIGVGSQEQANVVWSLTVLEKHQSPEAVTLISRIFEEAAEACEDQLTIQLEHAHQLWQAYFLLQGESPEAVENVPAWFTEYLQKKWSLEKAREKLSSARHRSLSQTLHLMGVEHYNEHDEDIDVAIVLKDNAAWTHETETGESSDDAVSVAVEFDGPNHFTRERDISDSGRMAKPRALGHTVLKYRLLKKQGWSVVRVPYYEFDKIPFWASMVSNSICFYLGRSTFRGGFSLLKRCHLVL